MWPEMYLDPEYTKLIIETNKLKNEVAEKIVEKEFLTKYVFPEIKYSYILKLGISEAEVFLVRLKLDKLKRKISLYKDCLEYKNEIDEKNIDNVIEKEFKNENHEYTLMQEEINKALEFTRQEKIDENILKNINKLYRVLIKKLCPLLNLNNSRLENELYSNLEEAYKNSDIKKILEINTICVKNNIKSELEIDDFDNMINLKNIYNKLLEENKCIIVNIRSSEMFSNKVVLENENLIRRKKDEIKKQIENITTEYNKLLKEFEKLKKNK